MPSGFFKTVDKVRSLVNGLRFLKENYVLVGIPQEKTDRKPEDGITNAELMFIHTNGSPINNIPARPVIEPAIKENKEKISEHFKLAFQEAMKGNKDAAFNQLKLAGMRAQNAARAWFLDDKNGWPPNSPSVAARKRKKGSTEPRPLIDTGELRKSITFVVVKKGERTSGSD